MALPLSNRAETLLATQAEGCDTTRIKSCYVMHGRAVRFNEFQLATNDNIRKINVEKKYVRHKFPILGYRR